MYIAFADECTGTCATGNASTPEDSRDRLGSMYYLADGPSLYANIDDLDPLIDPSELEGN